MKLYHQCSALLAAAAFLVVVGCGPSMEEARQSLEDAKKGLKTLQDDNASSAESLLTRTMVKKAEAAFSDGDASETVENSERAVSESGKAMQARMRTRRGLETRLTAAKSKFFSVVYPRPALINNYFDALAAFQKRDYQEVSKQLNEFDSNYKLDRAFETEAKIELHFPDSSAAEDSKIPIFSDLTESGKLLNRIALLPDGYNVRYLTSVWINRDSRFLRIQFEVYQQRTVFEEQGPQKPKVYEGWVDGRFLAR